MLSCFVQKHEWLAIISGVTITFWDFGFGRHLHTAFGKTDEWQMANFFLGMGIYVRDITDFGSELVPSFGKMGPGLQENGPDLYTDNMHWHGNTDHLK